jgi:hypothetical protein
MGRDCHAETQTDIDAIVRRRNLHHASEYNPRCDHPYRKPLFIQTSMRLD